METQYLLNRILTIYAGEMSLNALKEISSFDKSYYQDGDDEETGEENDEKRLTLSVFCLTLICAALPARADKEFSKKSKNIWAWLKITKTGWKISFLWLRK